MQFIYNYSLDREYIEYDINRFIAFLREHDVESVTNLEISCYPWRNGKRLQSINDRNEICPVPIILGPGDKRYTPKPGRYPPFSIRERPDELGNFGLATAFNHDD
jgi:hypothetical protein